MRKWISLSLLILGGLVLVVFAPPLIRWLLPTNSSFTGPLEYGLEHLGAVVVVAMLIRGTLEAASQRELVSLVSDKVKQQVEVSIQKTLLDVEEKLLQPLQNSIKKLTDRLSYRIALLFGDTPLGEMLEASVLNPPFSRPWYRLHLKLEPLAEPDGRSTEFLKVFVGLSYQVRNVSGQVRDYVVESWLDDVIRSVKVSDGNEPGFIGVKYGAIDPPNNVVNRTDLEQAGRIFRQGGLIRLQVKMESIRPDESLYVYVDGMQLMRMEDHFVWNLTTVTEKVDVFVELAGGVTFDSLDVFPRAMHHITHDAFSNMCHRDENILKISVNQVFLPYQGIEIRWSPKAPPAESPA